MSRLRLSVFLAILALAPWSYATDAYAQVGRPVIVQPRRDLQAGDVFAGVPKSVSRLDPTNSGMYRILGRRDAEITITFTLPATLQSAAGDALPIQFGPNDAGFSWLQDQSMSVGFDPQVPYTVRLDSRGRAYIWLGGTVTPSSNQPAGYYESDVVLTASYTGN
jgi:hypothetical protein